MARNRVLELQEGIDGKWEYIPEPDESDIRNNLLFLTSIELSLRMRPWGNPSIPRSIVKAQDISIQTILDILPEWLKDTIYAISVLAEILTTRFMKDGHWVKIKWINVGWNFMSLIVVFRAAKDIVKAFKKPS